MANWWWPEELYRANCLSPGTWTLVAHRLDARRRRRMINPMPPAKRKIQRRSFRSSSMPARFKRTSPTLARAWRQASSPCARKSARSEARWRPVFIESAMKWPATKPPRSSGRRTTAQRYDGFESGSLGSDPTRTRCVTLRQGIRSERSQSSLGPRRGKNGH